MDSLTQILLGGTVAALSVPAHHRRAAIVAGGMLGTLPDLDALPLMLIGDPVIAMTWHRGPSHSLFVLPIVGLMIWAVLCRYWTRVSEAPRAWFWAIELALITHPLLDAFTVYGTQLLWPLPMRPVMWSSVFIIDPLYTLPLLAGVIGAAVAGTRRFGRTWLLVGIVLSSGYLGWSLAAKSIVEREADAALATVGLADAPRVTVPAPFNTLLWTILVMTPDGYLVGEHSLVADRGPIQFRAPHSDHDALAAVQDFPAVSRLLWFNHGFVRVRVQDDQLIVSDLRMGREPDYVFSFVVATRDGSGWRPITPIQLASEVRFRGGIALLWQRIWTEPD